MYILFFSKKGTIKFLLALFLVASSVSSSSIRTKTALVSAAPRNSIDPARQHMLDIAYLYANHRWAASETNLIQYPYLAPASLFLA